MNFAMLMAEAILLADSGLAAGIPIGMPLGIPVGMAVGKAAEKKRFKKRAIEGIESKEFSILDRNGKPMPVDEFLEFLGSKCE